MAVTSIWKVEGRLARVLGYAGNPDKAEGSPDEWELQGVGAAILYAADPGKTERQLYVTGVNCLPATALEEMNATKRQYGKTGGIVAFHGYQAFAPGETDPATAHEVGVALAQELWGGRFEVVVATHLDKAHLHNHFVVNSVSFADGRRFHRDAACYRAMREASDELCREHGLSVVESPGRGGVGAVECLLALALLPLRPRLLVELAFRREFPATAFFHHPVDILHALPSFLQGARHGLASRMRFAAHFACRRYGAHLRAHGQPAAALARCLTILF